MPIQSQAKPLHHLKKLKYGSAIPVDALREKRSVHANRPFDIYVIYSNPFSESISPSTSAAR